MVCERRAAMIKLAAMIVLIFAPTKDALPLVVLMGLAAVVFETWWERRQRPYHKPYAGTAVRFVEVARVFGTGFTVPHTVVFGTAFASRLTASVVRLVVPAHRLQVIGGLRSNARIARRISIDSREYRPCFHDPLRLPLGAPVPYPPPCSRQRPCFVCGDWQGVPRRVLAKHLGCC